MNTEQAHEVKRRLESDPEMARLQSAPLPSQTTEGLSACGCGYAIGSGTAQPTVRGVFIGLAAIESPLLDDLDSLTNVDVYRALYAACGPTEALEPVMALEQRLRGLRKHEDTAKTAPELYEAYLRRSDDIERGAWEAFDEAAFKFAGQFGDVAPTEILQSLLLMIRDSQQAIESMRGAQKKTDGTPGSQNTRGLSWRGRLVSALIRFGQWICHRPHSGTS